LDFHRSRGVSKTLFSSGRPPRGGPTQVAAYGDKCVDERAHVRFGMERRRCNSQPLLSTRNRGIVDRLNVDGVLGQEPFADAAAQMRIADNDRQDVAWCVPAADMSMARCIAAAEASPSSAILLDGLHVIRRGVQSHGLPTRARNSPRFRVAPEHDR